MGKGGGCVCESLLPDLFFCILKTVLKNKVHQFKKCRHMLKLWGTTTNKCHQLKRHGPEVIGTVGTKFKNCEVESICPTNPPLFTCHCPTPFCISNTFVHTHIVSSCSPGLDWTLPPSLPHPDKSLSLFEVSAYPSKSTHPHAPHSLGFLQKWCQTGERGILTALFSAHALTTTSNAVAPWRGLLKHVCL